MQTTLTQTTILDLPLEILQMIFSYCSYSEPLYPALLPGLARANWVPITHVCRHWRTAALNHHTLWTSINTEILGMSWAKVFMERSNPALVDVSVGVNPIINGVQHVNAHEVAALLTTGCTRLRSLHIIGGHETVSQLLDMLHTAISVRSLSLNILGVTSRSVKLPVNLFGGQAPIREVRFSVVGHIVAPHHLFHGVTHFTSDQHLPLRNMLDSLRQMSALESLTLKSRSLSWQDSDAPWDVPIPMPNLMHFAVEASARSPAIFTILHRRLTLPDGAKRRVCARRGSDWEDSAFWAPSVLTLIKAARGLRHMRLSGGIREGSVCLWTGDLGHEEAAFSFGVNWRYRSWGDPPIPIFRLTELYDLLGVEGVLTLSHSFTLRGQIDLVRRYWWDLLGKLSAVEDLELHVHAVRELKVAWDVDDAPAVLPALRSVRIVQANSSVGRVAEMTEERLMRLLQRSTGQHAD